MLGSAHAPGHFDNLGINGEVEVSETVFHGIQRTVSNALESMAPDGVFHRALLQRNLRKAPESAPDAGRRPPLEQHLAAGNENEHRRAAGGNGLPGFAYGQVRHPALAQRDTLVLQGTGEAQRTRPRA